MYKCLQKIRLCNVQESTEFLKKFKKGVSKFNFFSVESIFFFCIFTENQELVRIILYYTRTLSSSGRMTNLSVVYETSCCICICTNSMLTLPLPGQAVQQKCLGLQYIIKHCQSRYQWLTEFKWLKQFIKGKNNCCSICFITVSWSWALISLLLKVYLSMSIYMSI